MQSGSEAAIRAALDQLWVKFQPQIEQRLAVLEAAALALEKDPVSDAQCADAASAAHKLAGILGTFGIAEGTELAREAEILLCGDISTDSEAKSRLSAIAAQLAELVRSRNRRDAVPG